MAVVYDVTQSTLGTHVTGGTELNTLRLIAAKFQDRLYHSPPYSASLFLQLHVCILTLSTRTFCSFSLSLSLSLSLCLCLCLSLACSLSLTHTYEKRSTQQIEKGTGTHNQKKRDEPDQGTNQQDKAVCWQRCQVLGNPWV